MSGLWRWRHNPLRRRTDLVEAWVALVALVLMVFAAPAVGVLCGSLTDTSLRQQVTEQRLHRHVTAAVVAGRAEQRPGAAQPEGSTIRATRTTVVANWTAYDGSSRRGTLVSPLRATEPGATFRLWTDDHGRPVPPPMARSAADTHAVFAGLCAAAAAAGLIEGIRRLTVWRLIRRRYARLDRAWARYGPDWGRTGAGS
ncbi:hypothetical protein ACFYNY_29135 [Streptomyces sp. NPDC006530]|uniref:Rv1733c family protein n=1 Tax=Streptomyces sp. NPDC006530 TaxID=3364750 RepID=UPI00369FC000